MPAELTFTVPLRLVEIIIPLVSVGVFVPGFFIFGYLVQTDASDVHRRTLLVVSVGFLYVLGELLVIVLGAVLHRQFLSAQMARMQQVAATWLIPVIPFYLGGVLTTARRFRTMNRIVIWSGVVFAAAITIVAFAAPDLFRSVRLPHAMAFEVESTFGRGHQGPLTRIRDLFLLLIIVYASVLILLEVISHRTSRFSVTLLVGIAVALGLSVTTLFDSIVGPLPLIYPRSVVGLTVFALASTLAAAWRFVDEAKEVETAHGELRDQEQRLSYLAYHDQLTGARNRKAFFEVLTSRSRSARSGAGSGIALLYIDLDYFKQVNDAYGHRIGDLVLRRVTEQLQTGLRQTDALFRIGGDEFALVLETASDGSELPMIADKLISRFTDPIEVDGREFVVGLSIGAAIMPTHCSTVEELVGKADRALYHAKRERNAFRLYHSEMEGTPGGAVELLDALRTAVEAQEFTLHYQPVVATDGIAVSMEALLRWTPPNNRIIPVETVIELAEAAGLINRIGTWVLDTTLLEIGPRIASGRISYVSVNVSSRELLSRDFLSGITEAAARHDVAPSSIRLEIKESGVIESLPLGGARMMVGSGEGLRYIIDDFGRGYASLSYLHHLGVAAVKLDRELVREIPRNNASCAFLKGLLVMTGDLGIDVIAKGVESTEQKSFLESIGCRFFQGFLTGAPEPVARLDSP